MELITGPEEKNAWERAERAAGVEEKRWRTRELGMHFRIKRLDAQRGKADCGLPEEARQIGV